MSAPAPISPAAAGFGIGARFERVFVLAFCAGGLAFHAFAALEFGDGARGVAPLWIVAAAVLLLPAPLVTLIVALTRPLRDVRRLLRAHVAVFVLATLSLIPAVEPGAGAEASTWLLDAMPVAMTAAAVAIPPRLVPAAIAALCLLLLVVRAVVSESWTTAFEESLDMAMVGTVFAALAQAVLGAGHSLERATRDAVLSAAREAGRQGRRSERIRVGALVHDEILSFLLNVERISRSPDRSRAAARDALAHLAELRRTDPEGPTASRAVLRPEEFVGAARVRIAEAAPLATIEAEVRPGAVAVPSSIADGVIDAAVQAARNAVQHARTLEGAPARIEVSLLLDDRGLGVEVRDDGGGFVLADVPHDRMGLRTSILARVAQLAGASAQVATDSGTVVRLEWRR